MKEHLSSTEISELVYTRISHDIIGNVGAVSNAVELLEEDDLDFLGDIKSILKTSSTTLSARLKFFRIAFGLNNASQDQLSNINKVTNDYLSTVGSTSTTIEAKILVNDVKFSKISMLLAMILGDILTKGGNISIMEETNAVKALLDDSAISKDRVNVVKSIINGDYSDKAAQYAPVYYLIALLEDAGYKLNISEEQNFGLIVGKY